MTPAQLRSIGLYTVWALIGAFVATGLNLAQQLSGTDLISIRSLGATFTTSFFGALATVIGTSQLTRFGSEQIAKQVDALKAEGVPKSEMVVLSQNDAAGALAAHRPELGTAFSPIQVQQLTDELERRARDRGGS